PAPDVRAFLAASGQRDREIGLVTGADGAVIWRQGSVTNNEIVDGGRDLSAGGVDAGGRGGGAGAGGVWVWARGVGEGDAARGTGRVNGGIRSGRTRVGRRRSCRCSRTSVW